MPGWRSVESNTIRIAVPLALLAAVLGGILIPIPAKLPAAALGSEQLLWALRALVIFYGFLLLFVPLVRGLKGQLPIELTLRGARYEELTTASLGALEARVVKLEQAVAASASILPDAVKRLGKLEDDVVKLRPKAKANPKTKTPKPR